MSAIAWRQWLGALALASLVPAAPDAGAARNPLAREVDPAGLAGRWNGANLETRSNCTLAQNDGQHGTYAEYGILVDFDPSGLFIEETTVTGLRCTYSGTYRQDTAGLGWTGNYSCSDGKHGTFRSRDILVTPHEMSIRLVIKLDGSESCDVEAILGGSRF